MSYWQTDDRDVPGVRVVPVEVSEDTEAGRSSEVRSAIVGHEGQTVLLGRESGHKRHCPLSKIGRSGGLGTERRRVGAEKREHCAGVRCRVSRDVLTLLSRGESAAGHQGRRVRVSQSGQDLTGGEGAKDDRSTLGHQTHFTVKSTKRPTQCT